MTPGKVKVIVNPYANLRRAWKSAAALRPLVEEYTAADWAGTVYPTHATQLALDAALAGYDLVIAVGGDGTVHEVVNGLMQVPAERRPALGVVPFGLGNDFAFAVGMDPSPEAAVRQIFTSTPRPVDLGFYADEDGREHYFSNAAGIGLDTLITLRTRRILLLKGFPVFLIAAIQTIILDHDAPRMRLRMDGEVWEEQMPLLVLCNGSREGGGFRVAPQARPDDGLLDMLAVRQVTRRRMFAILPEVMRGTQGNLPEVRMPSFETLDIQSDRPLMIHLDGEIIAGFGSHVRRISIHNEHNILRVMAPAREPRPEPPGVSPA